MSSNPCPSSCHPAGHHARLKGTAVDVESAMPRRPAGYRGHRMPCALVRLPLLLQRRGSPRRLPRPLLRLPLLLQQRGRNLAGGARSAHMQAPLHRHGIFSAIASCCCRGPSSFTAPLCNALSPSVSPAAPLHALCHSLFTVSVGT